MALYKVDSDTADLTKVAGGTLYADLPIGSIVPFGGAVAPSGWFICQRQAISRTIYAELFAVIGTKFGSGDGSTTFNLPDLRNKAVMGAGTTGALGASQSAQLPNITGKIDNKTGTFGIMGFSSSTNNFSGALKGSEAKGAVYTGQQNTSACKVVTFDASYSGASTDINGNNVYKNNGETRPANVRLNYIIKAKQVSVPFDVAEYIRNQNILSDWENITLPTTAATAITMQYDGFIYIDAHAEGEGVGAWVNLYVNGKLFRSRADTGAYNINTPSLTVPVKKGDVVYLDNSPKVVNKRAAFYKLRDYTGR